MEIGYEASMANVFTTLHRVGALLSTLKPVATKWTFFSGSEGNPGVEVVTSSM